METKDALSAEISCLVDAVLDALDQDADVDSDYAFMRSQCPARLHRVLDGLPVLTLHMLDGIQDESMSLSSLARRTGRPKGTVSKHVAQLVGCGLVRREAIPGNRKEQTLTPTADGAVIAAAHTALHARTTQRRQEFLRGYTRTELQVLRRVLRNVLAHTGE